MTGSFEHKPEGKIGADKSISAGERELKRTQFVEGAKLRRLLKGERELLGVDQIVRLAEVRLKELERLGRRGVADEMMKHIPKFEPAESKISREVQIVEWTIKFYESILDSYEEGLRDERLSEEDRPKVEKAIEKYKQDIEREKLRLAELKAKLEEL